MRVYFDYNATTPLAPGVLEVMMDAMDLKNPSSPHKEGREARNLLEETRGRAANYLDCRTDEIYWTSGATEANNTVLEGCWVKKGSLRNKILITAVEHESVEKPAAKLRKMGAELHFIPVNREGEVDLQAYSSLLDDRTLLVCGMLANNETGVVYPVREMAKMAHARGALFHADAACAVGKIPFSFANLEADLLSFSAHKFYGPKGVGALLIRKGISPEPLFIGGPQERGLRAGTENISGAVGLAAALSFALENMDEENHRLFLLRNKIKRGLQSLDYEIVFHEHRSWQLPGTLNVAFLGISGQTLLAHLDLEGASVSYGAACSSGSLEPSRVLLAMGVPEPEAASSIRISFGRMTTDEEVTALLRIFEKVLRKMRKSVA